MEFPPKKISLKIAELRSKKKSIEADVNSLRIIHETEHNRVTHSAEGLTSLKVSIKELETLLESAGEYGVNFLGEINVSINEGMKTLREIESLTKLTLVALNKVHEMIDTRKKELIDIDRVNEEKSKNIKIENARLSILREDLDIYKSRLQKKYDELGLGILIL